MIRNIAINYWDEIYGQNLKQIISNNDCNECRKYCQNENLKQSHPVLLNYVGENFEKDPNRILFIGLEAYFTKEYEKDCTFKIGEKPNPNLYVFSDDDMEFLFFKENSNFWKWVRRITRKIYGENDSSFNSIAWSNLNKCKVHEETIAKSGYDPYFEVSNYCINKCKWIHSEINVLEPKNVIVLGMGDDKMLPEIFFQNKNLDFQKIDNTYYLQKIDKENGINYFWTYHPNYLDRLPENVREKIFSKIVSSFHI